MKKSYFLVLAMISCGDPSIDIGGRYEPKIVLEGLLNPGRSVSDIRISRNVPLGTLAIPPTPLEDAVVVLTDETTGFSAALTYDDSTHSFEDQTRVIEASHVYRLDVDAVIDGETLHASSRTTTPGFGFSVSAPGPDSLAYNAKDDQGRPVKISIPYVRSVGTADYVFSIQALDASIDSFIYSPVNPIADVDSEDVLDEDNEFLQSVDFVINTPSTGGSALFNVELYHTWFYGRYRVIVYAVDRNFRDFLITHEQVQEADGNYHEPIFYIEGDGIGYFGSAIADTTYFKVLRP